MKLSFVVGRKGQKFKALYVGTTASEASEAMDAALANQKSKFDEVAIYKSPMPFSRRRISA
tara:strand:+ start:421 stop:603 length:183 start_codon:yes stop_codon:yes gene_type:complete